MANHQTKGAGMVRDLLAHLTPEGGALWPISDGVLIGALCEWHPDGDEYAGWWGDR